MSKKGSNPMPPKGVTKPAPPPNPPKPVNIWDEDDKGEVKERWRARITPLNEYNGSECPYCHSTNILAVEQVQADGTEGTQSIECHDCGRMWYDIWQLKGWMEAP